MPIRVKVNSGALSNGQYGGGFWAGPVANGHLRIRYAGNWYNASNCYIKYGGVGAGWWYDSGYRGYPAVPINFSVYAWDYSGIALQWNAGPGGAPVSSYQVVITDANGNPDAGGLAQYEVTSSPWNGFSVSWDYYYQLFIRSKSAEGLYSAWSAPIRAFIGHPQQDTWGYVDRARPWQSSTQWNYRFRNEWFAIQIPNSIYLTAMHWRRLRSPQGSIVSPTGSRLVQYILDTQWDGYLHEDVPGGVIYSDSSYCSWDIPLANWANDGWWGFAPVGGGWGTAESGNTYYALFADAVYLTGDEHYSNYEVTSSIPALGNNYW